MARIGDTNIKLNIEHTGNIQYIRLNRNSTISTCSSIVLSSCSSDEEYDDNQFKIQPLQWKRQKILNTVNHNSERPSSNTDSVGNATSERHFGASTKENIATTGEDERRARPPRRLPHICEDKLHRRNPHIVQQEFKTFDDTIPNTTLADVHLSEMPGLQNTEQWKRIAGRTAHASPPLSRQYYSTVVSTLGLQDGQVPQTLGSYRQPGRTHIGDDGAYVVPSSSWRSPRRPIVFGSSAAVVLIAITLAVVLAVTLIRRSDLTTSDYYAGSIYVRADFDASLLDPSSVHARERKREFCQLVRATLVDSKSKYARFYSTCSVIDFYNGSIIADFILGFTSPQDIVRLNLFLNRTLVNEALFGGTILSIDLDTVPINTNYNNYDYLSITNNISSTNNKTKNNNKYKNKTFTNGKDEEILTNNDSSGDDTSYQSGKLIMNEQVATNGQEQPTQTSYTTVTYKTLEKGLSITISETITITNNSNFENFPINNKNYELILVPTTDSTKTIVVPSSNLNEKTILPPVATITTTTTTAAAATPTNAVAKSSSSPHLLRPPSKPISDTNFAYIDESSDDHSIDSRNVASTLEELTTEDSTTSASTTSLNDETLTNSASSIVNHLSLPTKPSRPNTQMFPPKLKEQSWDDKPKISTRSNPTVIKRQRRLVLPKKHRRLLQYELMPTGKVYYVDQPFNNQRKKSKDDHDSNSSTVHSTLLSRSSSVDTLSDKRYRQRHRHHQHHHYHQQQQQPQDQHHRYPPNPTLTKPEQKVTVGGRLASTNNLTTTTATTTTSPFKPINTTKKKRFSSFEPTPESLDRVFDVLIAADKQRERHEFWKEKFDARATNSRPTALSNRNHEITNSNTIPSHRLKSTHLTVNSTMNQNDGRSQSYTNKRNSSYANYNRQNTSLLEDCLRRQNLIIQQQQQQQQQHKLQELQSQRNYSPNTIYSTNYPKQQLPPTGKPPLHATATNANQLPVRILPLPNGRVSRAPQARQTSDELSSTSDVWATRSSLDEESKKPKNSINPTRFQSAVNRNRNNEQKIVNNKRASSVEQQKPSRPQTKNLTTKSKFFDLFKFTR